MEEYEFEPYIFLWTSYDHAYIKLKAIFLYDFFSAELILF